MTTYSYTLVMDDRERIMLEAALKMMLDHCNAELADGPKAPYWAWRRSAKEVLSRLRENMELTSYYVFPEDKSE